MSAGMWIMSGPIVVLFLSWFSTLRRGVQAGPAWLLLAAIAVTLLALGQLKLGCYVPLPEVQKKQNRGWWGW